MFFYFLQGLALGFPAAATPGPMHAFYLGQTMKSGWRRTLPAALAPLISDGPIILLVLLVLAQTPGWMLDSLRIAGGLFILYLAWSAYRAFQRPSADLEVDPESSRQGLSKAVITNLLNPNPYIFWSVVAGPVLLGAWRQSAAHGASFLLGFYGTLVGGFALLILFFAFVGRQNRRLTRLLSSLSAMALLLFGLFNIWTGAAGLAEAIS
jgi:threonine/homoserine/homoserine lactone efflux protein